MREIDLTTSRAPEKCQGCPTGFIVWAERTTKGEGDHILMVSWRADPCGFVKHTSNLNPPRVVWCKDKYEEGLERDKNGQRRTKTLDSDNLL